MRPLPVFSFYGHDFNQWIHFRLSLFLSFCINSVRYPTHTVRPPVEHYRSSSALSGEEKEEKWQENLGGLRPPVNRRFSFFFSEPNKTVQILLTVKNELSKNRWKWKANWCCSIINKLRQRDQNKSKAKMENHRSHRKRTAAAFIAKANNNKLFMSGGQERRVENFAIRKSVRRALIDDHHQMLD